jgi:hypothetical protein
MRNLVSVKARERRIVGLRNCRATQNDSKFGPPNREVIVSSVLSGELSQGFVTFVPQKATQKSWPGIHICLVTWHAVWRSNL